MRKLDRLGWADGLCFHSYGLRVGIRVNEPALLERLPDHLPPGWKPAASPVVDRLYSLRAAASDSSAHIRSYNLLYVHEVRLARSTDLNELLEPLESDLQLYVAEHARRRVFVHAGVVGWRGKAIVIPGMSFAGKTTLVAALVRAGATYYSDEYAVFDAQGRVHPFPRRLMIRDTENGTRRHCGPEALGGRVGVKPLTVGLIAVTHYRAGARWRPRPLSPGQAVLALLANTVPARRNPAAVLAALPQVACRAARLKGSRGEADETARALLTQLDE